MNQREGLQENFETLLSSMKEDVFSKEEAVTFIQRLMDVEYLISREIRTIIMEDNVSQSEKSFQLLQLNDQLHEFFK